MNSKIILSIALILVTLSGITACVPFNQFDGTEAEQENLPFKSREISPIDNSPSSVVIEPVREYYELSWDMPEEKIDWYEVGYSRDGSTWENKNYSWPSLEVIEKGGTKYFRIFLSAEHKLEQFRIRACSLYECSEYASIKAVN